jgi:hypothetical protein
MQTVNADEQDVFDLTAAAEGIVIGGDGGSRNCETGGAKERKWLEHGIPQADGGW